MHSGDGTLYGFGKTSGQTTIPNDLLGSGITTDENMKGHQSPFDVWNTDAGMLFNLKRSLGMSLGEAREKDA